MPAPHILALIRNGKPRGTHEIDCDESGDVGDAQALARDKGPAFKVMIEEKKETFDARLVRLGPCGHLRNLQGFHRRVSMAKNVGDGEKEIEFEPAIPHFDLDDLPRTPAEQRRLGSNLLEITADRDGFGNDGAVIENENRHLLQRIDRGKAFRLVLQGANVDLLLGDLHAFLGKENPDAARVGRAVPVVKLHPGTFDEGCRFAAPLINHKRCDLPLMPDIQPLNGPKTSR
jgi:hypothetical protein